MHSLQRLPKASCGVLPVSIFRDARVNYVMRRLGEATDEFFDALLSKLETIMPGASEQERREAMLEGLARTVPGWSAPVVSQRVQRLLELARDFEANMHAAFAIYVKDTYAQDLRGRTRKVQVCMPKLSAFLHMYFTRIVVAPEVKRGAYFDRTSTVARNFAVCNALLDALAEVCVENVRVVDVGGGSSSSSSSSAGASAQPLRAGSSFQQQQQQQRPPPPQPSPPAAVGPSADSDFDDASSFASMAPSEGGESVRAPAAAAAAAAGSNSAGIGHHHNQQHPFDNFMQKSAAKGPATGRFQTFVPPATAGVGAAASGSAAPAAGAASSAAPAAPAAPAATPVDEDGSSSSSGSEEESSSDDAAAPPPLPPRPPTASTTHRKHTRSTHHRRVSTRKPTATGAMALLRKLQGKE